LTIRGKLREYGRAIKDRTKVKLLSASLSLFYDGCLVASEKSVTAIGLVLIVFEEINEIKKLFFGFTEKAQYIQRVWRGVKVLDNTRRLILRSKWDEAIQKLIKQHTKGKKQSLIATKLMEITGSEIDKTLSNYYTMKKDDYHKVVIKNSKNKQIFKYIPSNEVLNKMILKLTHNH